MTRLIFSNQQVETDRERIVSAVAGLGAQLRYKAPPADAAVQTLLRAPQPTAAQQAALLEAIDAHIADWLPPGSPGGHDLIVFHDDVPGLDALRDKFRQIHTHQDDEIRYIVSGTGYFGFVAADGDQVLLEVGAGDYLNVPSGAEHWFSLGDDPHLKAVRYFGEQHDWVAHFTNRAIDPALLTG